MRSIIFSEFTETALPSAALLFSLAAVRRCSALSTRGHLRCAYSWGAPPRPPAPVPPSSLVLLPGRSSAPASVRAPCAHLVRYAVLLLPGATIAAPPSRPPSRPAPDAVPQGRPSVIAPSTSTVLRSPFRTWRRPLKFLRLYYQSLPLSLNTPTIHHPFQTSNTTHISPPPSLTPDAHHSSLTPAAASGCCAASRS